MEYIAFQAFGRLVQQERTWEYVAYAYLSHCNLVVLGACESASSKMYKFYI